MAEDLRQQLIELQTEFSFQEDLLTALNSRVVEQDKEIDRLHRMLLLLQQTVERLADSVPASATPEGSERPPHY